jgi:hypothetical protein
MGREPIRSSVRPFQQLVEKLGVTRAILSASHSRGQDCPRYPARHQFFNYLLGMEPAADSSATPATTHPGDFDL